MLNSKNLKFARHSENKRNLNNYDVYIVDSYGESKSFYKISNVVFLEIFSFKRRAKSLEALNLVVMSYMEITLLISKIFIKC